MTEESYPQCAYCGSPEHDAKAPTVACLAHIKTESEAKINKMDGIIKAHAIRMGVIESSDGVKVLCVSMPSIYPEPMCLTCVDLRAKIQRQEAVIALMREGLALAAVPLEACRMAESLSSDEGLEEVRRATDRIRALLANPDGKPQRSVEI